MFGLTIVTKTEKEMWKQRIRELEVALSVMRQERDHERTRAERAVNLVLIKSAKVGISLTDKDEAQEMEKRRDLMMDIFGEEATEEKEKARLMEAIQSDRT